MIIKNKKGVAFNRVRKELFSTLKIVASNAEKDFFAFTKSSSDDDYTEFDTNWPASNNALPAHMVVSVERIGFSIHGVDGAAVSAATLRKLVRATYEVKFGDRPIKQGSLQEFFRIPGASSDVLSADYFTGPSYKDLAAPETLNPKDVLYFKVRVPASVGAVNIVPILDGVVSTKQ